MAIYYTNDIGGGGGGEITLKIGDRIVTHPSNIDLDPEISGDYLKLNYNQEQYIDGTQYPLLYNKTGYKGMGEILTINYDNKQSNGTFFGSSDGIISINKTEGETYVLNSKADGSGQLALVTNQAQDITNNYNILVDPISTSSQTLYGQLLFKNDDLYVFYGSTATDLKLRVYDTINQQWKTNEVFVFGNTGNWGFHGAHYNENTGKVFIFGRNSINSSGFECITTTDGQVMISEKTVASSIFGLQNQATNFKYQINKDGLVNYYNGKYYFKNSKGTFNDIYTLDEITFDFVLHTTLTNTFTGYGGASTQQIKVTKNGVFYFCQSFNSTTREHQFVYSEDDFNTIIYNNFTFNNTITELTLLDDNSAMWTSNNDNTVFTSTDLQNSLYVQQAESNNSGIINYSIVDGDKVLRFFTTSSSNGAVNIATYNTTNTTAPLVLPAGTITNEVLKEYIKAK